MDQERFDRITRTLASGQSRRGVLKGLTGTAIGGLLAILGLADASAAPCKAPNTKCGKGKNAQCCTSGQICTPNGCVAQTRFVYLTWNQSGYLDWCAPTVNVTGFEVGTYTGSISNVGAYEVIIVVGTDGTGSWSSSDISPNSFGFVATVDGVNSAPAIGICS